MPSRVKGPLQLANERLKDRGFKLKVSQSGGVRVYANGTFLWESKDADEAERTIERRLALGVLEVERP